MLGKFNEAGKLVSWSDADTLNDVRPDPTGFEEIGEWEQEDLLYLVKRDGVLTIDEEAKASAAQAALKAARYTALKAELEKVKEDIEQETFGMIRDDVKAKKRRAAEIVNELRLIEGKEPRETREDN